MSDNSICDMKYDLYFRFLKAATLYFVEMATKPLPSLSELHDVVT